MGIFLKVFRVILIIALGTFAQGAARRCAHRTEVTEAVSIRVRKNNKVTEKAIKLKQEEIKNIMGKKFMPSLSAKALKRVLSVGGTATNTSPNLFEENHKALRLTRRRKN